MLEVRNLRKIYKSKKGVDVHALDGVSLQFPQTGMVFLLGKSGSGKSTLLNVCGGLDAPTDGEIIVKGRSSKSFSESDFDSYRNTFIGFIFQEYNILNEFSVEENIALALELQGKPKNKAAINALLEEVDLKGYAKRKPNTLSGGQKQRIAIARALVKAPEIIMADEPTGALDSNTGKQVFDTLKKLSQTKLVIVVSHDRDFAEQYGDRIIELSDGKVISDISKTQLKQQQLSGNVNAVGDVLCIKRGTDLTDNDFDQIKAFLKKSDKDVIIASDENDVQNFKKVSRISDDGGKEVFSETDNSKVEKKQYTKADSKFIRSKLPIRHAFKIGTSGMKNKPFRLFFTILLCTVAFVMFGMLSTMTFYDSRATFDKTLSNSGPMTLQLTRQYKQYVSWYENGQLRDEYESFSEARFTPDDINAYAQKYGAEAFGAISFYGGFNLRQTGRYWKNEISRLAVLPENHSLRNGMIGTYPKENGELAISSYFAQMLVECDVYNNKGELIEADSAEQLIGLDISMNGHNFTVVGVVQTGEIPAEYDALKQADYVDYNMESDFYNYMMDNVHTMGFVAEEYAKSYRDNYWGYKEEYTYIVTSGKYNGEYKFMDWYDAVYQKADSLSENSNFISFGTELSQLGDNQVILSSRQFAEKVQIMYNYWCEDRQDWDTKAFELCDKIYLGGTYVYPDVPKEDYKDDEKLEPQFIPLTDEELKATINTLLACMQRDGIKLEMGLKLFDMRNNTSYGDVYDFTIAGIVVMDDSDIKGSCPVYMTENAYNRLWDEQKMKLEYYSEYRSDYVEPEDAIYTMLYLPYVYSPDTLETYWQVYNETEFNEQGTREIIRGGCLNSLQMVDSMVKDYSEIFLYVGLVFAVFAILLLSNFISTSISQKKKEIGILRAVGARSADVFKIFFSESFVIAAICVALSTAASIWLCDYLNQEMARGIGASLLVFGPLSFAVLIGSALLTVIVATFLPVNNAARKKPVESIRAL